MLIYDYDNCLVDVELREAKIEMILVTILSGDETGTVLYADGKEQYFNAAPGRLYDFFDGSYIVPKELVAPWMAYPDSHNGGSYKRQDWFSDLFKEWGNLK